MIAVHAMLFQVIYEDHDVNPKVAMVVMEATAEILGDLVQQVE